MGTYEQGLANSMTRVEGRGRRDIIASGRRPSRTVKYISVSLQTLY